MSPSASSIAKRNLVFVSGKGGVGKSVVSQALALALSRKGNRTLWATFEDPLRPMGELQPVARNLWHLNCEGTKSFQEYAATKIGVPGLARIFLQNKLIRYLSKAAPGIHELVLLGKVWFEREHYDRVIVDMPSTGYGLAMFQSTANFSELFKGGPIHRDAEAMLETFRDPVSSGQLIVGLPEEMPLRESLELGDYLSGIFPKNPAAFVVNRRFPSTGVEVPLEADPDRWPSPVPASTEDYVRKRVALEEFNLRIWREAGITHDELGTILPGEPVVQGLASEMERKGWVV